MFLQSINVSEFWRLKRERGDLVLLVSTNFEKKMQLIGDLQNIAPKYLSFIKFLDIGLYIKAVLKNNELLDRFLSNTFGRIVNLKNGVTYIGQCQDIKISLSLIVILLLQSILI